MNKFISIDEAVDKVKDGMTVMIGGFLANGTPLKIIDAMVKTKVKNLTVI
jgi:acetate CoA/acetoacetate CoA-transferase alpha subunit